MRNIKRFYQHPIHIDNTFLINGIGIEELMRPGMVDRPRGTGDWLIMYFPVSCQIMEQQHSLENCQTDLSKSAHTFITYTVLWHWPQTLQLLHQENAKCGGAKSIGCAHKQVSQNVFGSILFWL